MGRIFEKIVKVIAIVDAAYWLFIFFNIAIIRLHLLMFKFLPSMGNQKSNVRETVISLLANLLPPVALQIISSVGLVITTSPQKAPGIKWKQAAFWVVTHDAAQVWFRFISIAVAAAGGVAPARWDSINSEVTDIISLIFILVVSLYMWDMWRKKADETVVESEFQAETLEM